MTPVPSPLPPSLPGPPIPGPPVPARGPGWPPLLFWVLLIAAFGLAVWLVSGVLLPFVAGTAIAYLLDPIADRLERLRLPRWLATSLVLLSFVLVLVMGLILLAPLLREQIEQLIAALPQIGDWARQQALPWIERLVNRLAPEDVQRLRNAAGDYAGTAVSWGVTVLRGIVTRSLALFDVLSILFITPIVAFYLLRDWDKMVVSIDHWLPRRHAPVIREQIDEIDATLSGFVRGQATVCLALGSFYAVGLSVVGLNFGLVIGLLAGLLSFIPYVGTAFGFVASTGIALFQYDSWMMVGVVVGIFLVGQALEGNVLTPKLVGDRVGLHPVWVMMAVLAGGSLFGFLGVLIAVPVAAVIGVLIRFALRRYLQSPYYTGERPGERGAP